MNFKELKEKMWRRKIPKEYRDCTAEEMEAYASRLREEFFRLKETDFTEEDLLEFLLQNEKLLMALDVIERHEFEQRVWNS